MTGEGEKKGRVVSEEEAGFNPTVWGGRRVKSQKEGRNGTLLTQQALKKKGREGFGVRKERKE